MACITLLLECDMTQMPKEHLEQAKRLFAWIIQRTHERQPNLNNHQNI